MTSTTPKFDVATPPTYTPPEKPELSLADHGRALKSLAALVAAVGVLIGAVLTVDARYAHAEELKVTAIRQQQQVTELHHSFVDDKLFELSLRKANDPKHWTQMDELMLERYKAKLASLEDVKSQQRNMLKSVETKK